MSRPSSRLEGSTTIEPGYAKSYTPDEMRMWADDLDRYIRAPPAEVERWRATATTELTPEQRRVLAVHDKFYTEAALGIKGSLRDDGKVELDGGRHRAGYLLERDVDPIPVWVSARDEQQLDAFEAQCARERPARTEAPAREERPPRVAPADGRERGDDNQTGGERART